MLNVGVSSVKNAAVVRDHGVTELQERVAKGQTAPSTAADLARLPELEQREIVARGEKEIMQAATLANVQNGGDRRSDQSANLQTERAAG